MLLILLFSSHVAFRRRACVRLDGDDFVRFPVLDAEVRGVFDREFVGEIICRRIEPIEAARRDIRAAPARIPGQRDDVRDEQDAK
jgi:hypothetical protein